MTATWVSVELLFHCCPRPRKGQGKNLTFTVGTKEKCRRSRSG